MLIMMILLGHIHKINLIKFVNSLIHRGNAETKFAPVVTQGVEQRNDQTITVHKRTAGKLVISRKNLSLLIFDEQ